VLSKFIGCMLGCAVSDALGYGYWLGSYSRRWSDDTHMMIVLLNRSSLTGASMETIWRGSS